jgi:hypothetical protein
MKAERTSPNSRPELAAGEQGRLVYFALYLLWRGWDLRKILVIG